MNSNDRVVIFYQVGIVEKLRPCSWIIFRFFFLGCKYTASSYSTFIISVAIGNCGIKTVVRGACPAV